MDFSKKLLLWFVTPALAIAAPWKKHVIYEGARANVAVAADFTGDGKLDVISNSGQQTRLFVAPDWKEHIIDDTAGHNFIHGEVMDVDNDGDPDFIGARATVRIGRVVRNSQEPNSWQVEDAHCRRYAQRHTRGPSG